MVRRRVVNGFVGLLVVAALMLIGCAPSADTRPDIAALQVTMLSPQELRHMLEAKDFTLINVHVPFEGEIVGTDSHIPYNEIEKHDSLLPTSRDAKLVLYCKSGGMVGPAAKTLMEMGYSNLYDLEGGFIAWKGAGYELVTERP